MWVKDKKHMSSRLVIWFYITILFDIILCLVQCYCIHEKIDYWYRYGISLDARLLMIYGTLLICLLLCILGLIILLKAFEKGGYLVIFASAVMLISMIFIATWAYDLNGGAIVASGLILSVVNVAPVLVVRLRSNSKMTTLKLT